jgi:SNF2 family DNA or RNA helicase
MGLGKTVQVLAYLARLHERGELRPTLLVLPLTLLDNWERELRRFVSADIRVHRHEGSRAARLGGLRRGADLVLVSYDTLRRDQLELAKIDWKAVICDEAQYAKNPTAQRTSVVKALKADHRVALTGTPVENGMVELWCIMDFVQPGRLGSWQDFRTKFERPLVDDDDETSRRQTVNLLQNELRPHYLRRLKDDVLVSLPPKTVASERVPLSTTQLVEYRKIAREAKAAGRGAALGAITRLLQLSSSPPSDLRSGPIDEQIASCPKLARVLELTAEIKRRGEKVAIFTRFLKLQNLLQAAIQHRFGLFPDCINGAITANRQRILDIFSEKPGFNVIVMSHDVAGIGLNVTAANHVIHYTRPWNPAKESQTSDRVHRIGQDRAVTIYLPVAVAGDFRSVDERLDELLQEKAKLARDVLVARTSLEIRADDLWECVDQAAANVAEPV